MLTLALAPAAGAAPDWTHLTPAEFARRPELQARLDPARFDGPLLAAAIFHETNRVRTRLGLKPFTPLPQLDQAADLKAALGIFEPELRHESAFPHTATPAARVESVGLRYARVAENLARLPSYDLPEGMTQLEVRNRHGRDEFFRTDTHQPVELRTYAGFAEYVVASWMKSPGHRANILNPALVSLGCAARRCESVVSHHEQVYAVQVFFTPAR